MWYFISLTMYCMYLGTFRGRLVNVTRDCGPKRRWSQGNWANFADFCRSARNPDKIYKDRGYMNIAL